MKLHYNSVSYYKGNKYTFYDISGINDVVIDKNERTVNFNVKSGKRWMELKLHNNEDINYIDTIMSSIQMELNNKFNSKVTLKPLFFNGTIYINNINSDYKNFNKLHFVSVYIYEEYDSLVAKVKVEPRLL